MARALELRFGVIAEDGARSGAFSIWVPSKKNDIYIAARSIGGLVKGTVHLDGSGPSARHFGFTGEAVAELQKRSAPLGRPRHLVEFPGMKFADGSSIECRVCIPRYGLSIAPPPPGSEKVIWLPAPAPGHMLNFYLLVAPANAEVVWNGAQKLAHARVADGRQVLVLVNESADGEILAAVEDMRAKMKADGAKLSPQHQHSHRMLLFDVQEKGYLGIVDIAAREVMPVSEDGSESLGLRGTRWPARAE